MTSSTTLIQRAAELVIEFGLDRTGWTEEHLRLVASSVPSAFYVRWRIRTSDPETEVMLYVGQERERIRARIRTQADVLSIDDAKRVFTFAGRVVELAERIEALR